MAPLLAVVYWAAQLVGATAGALLLHVVLATTVRPPAAVPQLAEGIGAGRRPVIEVVLTFST